MKNHEILRAKHVSITIHNYWKWYYARDGYCREYRIGWVTIWIF